ncbi:MAG: 23S rRNA (adenine(2503)-C(2))-methyltransferase RlmN [Candidatus Omnitrophota bacterium]|nr:MAG: 23S rRNA (adenine(2503)-C(2))-methyltransferase RlmN [Candidatus Omnitrophota bacterium]
MKQDLKNFTQEQLREIFKTGGFAHYRAKQIFAWIYKRRVEDFESMTDLSKDAREFLKKNFFVSQLELQNKETSRDGTEKFLFGLDDGSAIETVLIPEGTRHTLCISSQVGCKFKCTFCMSGQGGLKRNLEVSEIINQYLYVVDLISPKEITNIVFMGVGEPLDNFENVLKAIKILMNSSGVSFVKRRICISTCGLIPEIKKLIELNLGVKLSISLHSADEDIRSKIMPVNKKYPLGELLPTLKAFSKKERYPVTFEYVLIKDLNTSKGDAIKLAKLLSGVRSKLNLIIYNASFLKYRPPPKEQIDIFTAELKKRGVFFTLRKSKGQDISAACGQLRAHWQKGA